MSFVPIEILALDWIYTISPLPGTPEVPLPSAFVFQLVPVFQSSLVPPTQ